MNIAKRIIATSLFLILAAPLLVYGAQSESNLATKFDEISSAYISSYPVENTIQAAIDEMAKKAEAQKNLSFVERVKRAWKGKQFDHADKPLSNYERARLTSEVHKSSNTWDIPGLVATSSNIAKKMELVCGGESLDKSLLAKIDGTYTEFGRSALAQYLCNPTADYAELESRQAALKELVNNKPVFLRLRKELDTITAAQDAVLRYQLPVSSFEEEMINEVFFSSLLMSKLNTSQIALETSTRLTQVFRVLSALQTPLAIFGVGAYFDWKEKGWNFGMIKAGAQLIGRAVSFLNPYNSHGYVAPGMPNTLGDFYSNIDCDPFESISTKRAVKGIVTGYVALIAGGTVFNFKAAVEKMKFENQVHNFLQERLINVATHLRSLKHIAQLAKNNPVLSKNWNFIHDITELFNPESTKHSAECKQLVSMLMSPTFGSYSSFFSNQGKVLAAHKLMLQCKDELAAALAAGGKADAFVSMAKLYTSAPEAFCFAKFVRSSTPVLQTKNFWNPFLDVKKAVANNIFLNAAHKDTILTGPNTCGKSTILKGLLLNVIFAQTFGMAPATEMILTPFSVLNCYLNVTDDISSGASLFQAEVNRVKELLAGLEGLDSNSFGFTIMDEVFSGTSPDEGARAAYGFCQKLGKLKNSSCILATHFGSLADLESKESAWHNMHVKAIMQEDGTYKRPFTLHEGSSSQNIADYLLREAGIL